MSTRRVTTRQVSAGTLVVLALALGQWLDDKLPATADAARPFEVEVGIGETVSLRTGDLEVLSVEGAPSVVGSGTGRVSPGLFTVVDFTFTPTGESSGLTYAALHDNRGRVLPFFGSSGRNAIECSGSVTGTPVRCFALVEAAASTLVGATVTLGVNGFDERWDSLAVVDLAITERDVEEWANLTEPLQLPTPGPVSKESS